MNPHDEGFLADRLASPAQEESIVDMIGVQTAPVGAALVGVLTLARPEYRNAMTLAGWRRLDAMVRHLSENTRVRAIVIRGAGDQSFSAGADISEFPTERSSPETGAAYGAAISAALRAIQSAPVPVIAMISGFAVGGGCELAAACDVRIASTDSRFGIPIGKLGVTLGLTETRAVLSAIGAASLKHLVYSGKLVTAERASRIGLVQEVVDRDDLATFTASLVRNIVMSAETTVRATKILTELASDSAVQESEEFVASLTVEAYGGADLREGVDAFLHGRTPRFAAERSSMHVRA
ncbi:enoyl-CoA hydratase/isomerase family protein [Leifsonia sp. NPDC056665]|uniref:enoyl-CoA hydratase/isomerase family protein n=1 Tax=Leifsonia sp. NPDC056665 TaxID=3345901 RepID=UPI0036D1F005